MAVRGHRRACATWPVRPAAQGTVAPAHRGDKRLVRRTLTTRITTRVVLLSATAAALVGIVLVVLIVAVSAQRDAARSAFRSQEALTAGSQLEKSLISIENGVRGYVASGRERFLTPATQSLGAYPRELRALRRLVDDDVGQQRRVADIGEAIDDYVLLWARPLISLARERPAQARSVVVTNGGRERLDAIRGAVRRPVRARASGHPRPRGPRRDPLLARHRLRVRRAGARRRRRHRRGAVPAPRGRGPGPRGRRGHRQAGLRRAVGARARQPAGRDRRPRARLQPDGRLARARPGRARALQRRAQALQRRARSVRVGDLARPAGPADDDLDVHGAHRAPPRGRPQRRPCRSCTGSATPPRRRAR